jgi:parvulin-like peptidyl-prolyl isomerase
MHFKTAAAALLLLAAIHAANAAVIDRLAVIVNDDVVTGSELDSIRQLQLHVSGLPAEETVLQERIDHHLVLQQIEKQPPLAFSAERYQEIIDSFVRKHGGAEEEFLVFLNSIGMNYQDFEKELREQLNIAAFIALRFRPFVNVSIEDAEKYYNEIYKPRLEKEGQKAPSFALSFDAIQQEIVDAQVAERTRQWLQELRKSSAITIKN